MEPLPVPNDTASGCNDNTKSTTMRKNGTNNRPKIGLACAGGVVEGAIYEIGALCAIDEAIEGVDLHGLDIYVGVSSGALVGSILANGIPARELSRAIVSRSTDPSLNLEPDVLFSPAIREYAGRLKQIPGAVVDTLKYYALNPRDLSLMGLLSTFGSILPNGFFDNRPLERFIAQGLSEERGRTNDFRRLPTQLRVVAMHLDSAELAVFGEPGLDHVPISKAVQASTALPGPALMADLFRTSRALRRRPCGNLGCRSIGGRSGPDPRHVPEENATLRPDAPRVAVQRSVA